MRGDLPVEFAALRRRTPSRKTGTCEFSQPSERAERSVRAESRALPFGRGLRAARTVARGDRLLQTGALGSVLR